MNGSHPMILTLTLLLVATPCGAQSEPAPQPPTLRYCVLDTGQTSVFSDQGQLLATPRPGEPFFGQDAQYQGPEPKYTRSADRLTVDEQHTGLTWQCSPEVNGDGELNPDDKLTWAQAQARPAALNAAKFGGYSDWRLPTIKELYSLIDFQGVDPSPFAADTANLRPFIDTGYFAFVYGDERFGERVIDSQYASCTAYVHETRPGSTKLFGVNFADGRIKGYDLTMPGGREKSFYVLCVRGNPNYGQNQFRDFGDGTIADEATGLAWAKDDSQTGMSWEESLAWVQARNRENMFGQWRDVHGAGSQRSDPKSGDPASFPQGRGPQGDAIRIHNFIRLVRSMNPESVRLVEPDLTPLPMGPSPRFAGPGPERGGLRGPGGRNREFHLIPPFAAETMNLTPDQQRQLTELEQEVKAKLDKILGP